MIFSMPSKAPPQMKQDICGIDLDQLLMRVLSSTLGRHGSYGSLQDLQKCLLYALTGHIAGDGRRSRIFW